MTDIEIIRTLTGNDSISDEFISFYLESTEQFIKSYCNIDSIPPALKPTYLEITAMRVKANSNGASSALGEGVKSVASVSDGNQSVSYASGASGSKQFISEEDFVSAYGYILDRYRRLVVDSGCPQKTLGSRCIHTRHPHPNTRW